MAYFCERRINVGITKGKRKHPKKGSGKKKIDKRSTNSGLVCCLYNVNIQTRVQHK